jgi:hypothetical protein
MLGFYHPHLDANVWSQGGLLILVGGPILGARVDGRHSFVAISIISPSKVPHPVLSPEVQRGSEC